MYISKPGKITVYLVAGGQTRKFDLDSACEEKLYDLRKLMILWVESGEEKRKVMFVRMFRDHLRIGIKEAVWLYDDIRDYLRAGGHKNV